MPQSKSRHAHKHAGSQQPPQQHAKSSKTNRIVVVATFFCALLGLGIGLFSAGDSTLALAVSTAIGAFAGFVFGYQVKKEF